MTFAFGHAEHERVEVDVLGYERAPVGDRHGDNWLTVRVRASASGFRADVDATFLTWEIIAFADQLRQLHENLHGTAEFSTLEGQLSLHLVGDGKGHIELRGVVSDGRGVGNHLKFTLELDQTQLGESVQQINRVVAQYPIRGANA